MHHRAIIETAQRDYYAVPNANLVHVSAYFTNAKGERRSKHELARTLSGFVQANVHRANPVALFKYQETPDGFESVVIVAESNPGDWWSGEVGGVTLADIRTQAEARIAAKDSLVDIYGSNLPDGAELWLLLYSGVAVARSMPIPHGIETWCVPFHFDREFGLHHLNASSRRFRRSDYDWERLSK